MLLLSPFHRRPRPIFLLLFAGALLLQGCTSAAPVAAFATVPQAQAGSLGCDEIASEWARATESRRMAAEAMKASWRSLGPIGLTTPYTRAQAAHTEAGQRLDRLGAQRSAQGCEQQAAR